MFEAKKNSAPREDVEQQLYEGASVYLSMLDDVARYPSASINIKKVEITFRLLQAAVGCCDIHILGWFGQYVGFR